MKPLRKNMNIAKKKRFSSYFKMQTLRKSGKCVFFNYIFVQSNVKQNSSGLKLKEILEKLRNFVKFLSNHCLINY